MLPIILFPAPVMGIIVGEAESPEVEESPPVEMTVNAGAEQDTVGADVRVTNWLE